jgi:hypothetical protein
MSYLTALFFLLIMPFSVIAAPPDFSTLVNAIDFTDVVITILAIFAGIAAVEVIRKGAKMITASIK